MRCVLWRILTNQVATPGAYMILTLHPVSRPQNAILKTSTPTQKEPHGHHLHRHRRNYRLRRQRTAYRCPSNRHPRRTHRMGPDDPRRHRTPQAFSLHKIETLTIEPAPEGTPSTLDDLENFAIRRQEGYEPTEEEFEEKWWASELYFRHPCGDVATFRL